MHHLGGSVVSIGAALTVEPGGVVQTGHTDSAPSADAVNIQTQREVGHGPVVETVAGFVVTVAFCRTQVTGTQVFHVIIQPQKTAGPICVVLLSQVFPSSTVPGCHGCWW